MRYLLLLMMSISAFAGYTVKSHIVEIEDNGDEKTLDVLVSYDGRIFKVDKENTSLIEELKVAREIGSQVEIDLQTNFVSEHILNEIEEIKEVRLLSREGTRKSRRTFVDEPISPMNNYIPSDLGTYEKAERIFKGLRNVGKTQRRSQCFNRAYVWSKYMYKTAGVRSMKVLIFYSRRYRREIKGSKWWFHIAPVVKVQDEYYTMDYEFHRRPKTVKDWQNFFTFRIPDKQYDCRFITHYSEFKKNYDNYSEWCFLQYTSMYYWEPNDIARVENEGIEKTRFSESILKIATKEAFRKHRRVFERVSN